MDKPSRCHPTKLRGRQTHADFVNLCVYRKKAACTIFAQQPLSCDLEAIDAALASLAKGSDVDKYVVIDNSDPQKIGSGSALLPNSWSNLPNKEMAFDLEQVIAKSDDPQEKRDLLESFVKRCHRILDTYVVFVRESPDVDSLKQNLQRTAVNKMRLDPQPKDINSRRFVLLNYDLKSAGESTSHPATRVPPLRQNGEHAKTCLRAALEAVADAHEGGLTPKDLVLLADGGRQGLKTPLLAGFIKNDGTSLPKSVRALRIFWDEESHLSRFDRLRGFQHDLSETVYTVTKDPLEMATKRRKIFGGTNRSNVIGPINAQPFTSQYHNMVRWEQKKDIWSSACKHQCRVGGSGPLHAEPTERKMETMEPVSFHAHTKPFWDEILHCHSVEGCIDFTSGAGYLGEACLDAKIPCVLVVQTDMHEEVIRQYLFRRLWDALRLEDPAFNAALSAPGGVPFDKKAVAVVPEAQAKQKKKEIAAIEDMVGAIMGRGGARGSASGSGGDGGSAPAADKAKGKTTKPKAKSKHVSESEKDSCTDPEEE